MSRKGQGANNLEIICQVNHVYLIVTANQKTILMHQRSLDCIDVQLFIWIFFSFLENEDLAIAAIANKILTWGSRIMSSVCE